MEMNDTIRDSNFNSYMNSTNEERFSEDLVLYSSTEALTYANNHVHHAKPS